MTQEEYEQKKKECWEEYWRTHKTYLHGDSAEIVLYETFTDAFDRAYALGKQESEEEIGEEIYDLFRNKVLNNEFLTIPGKPSVLDRYLEWSKVFKWTVNALGKQTETITREEIEKAAIDYIRTNPFVNSRTSTTARESFVDGANFALGKQEKDADTVIQGWVARDKDNNLFIYSDKPKRVYDGEFSRWEGIFLDTLSNSLFPDLTWDSEPQECEIIIKRKKNG